VTFRAKITVDVKGEIVELQETLTQGARFQGKLPPFDGALVSSPNRCAVLAGRRARQACWSCECVPASMAAVMAKANVLLSVRRAD
jgi:hypothetical protein